MIYHASRKTIEKYIREFYSSIPKERILFPDQAVILDKHILITRKSIKYIVHSRIADSYSQERIAKMLIEASYVLQKPELEVPNHNKRYPRSRIAGRSYHKRREALLVIYIPEKGTKTIFNAFYRSIDKYIKMLR